MRNSSFEHLGLVDRVHDAPGGAEGEQGDRDVQCHEPGRDSAVAAVLREHDHVHRQIRYDDLLAVGFQDEICEVPFTLEICIGLFGFFTREEPV